MAIPFLSDISGQGATFASTVTATNFSGSSSGTNTGDQDLSGKVSKTGDTMTGRLVLPDTGFSIGDEYHKWKRAYTVNSSSPQELLYHDGNSLPAGGAYRFHAHISGTGTDQSATAVYWNQNATWKVNVTYQSGTSSNHPEFIIAGSPERPTIHIDHTSNYEIQILGERLELSEGTGTDNKAGFGADAFIGSVNGVLRYNDAGTENDYTNGNEVWHAGNDGSGSGLDADKLDGEEGTYYLDYGNFTSTPTIPTDFVSKANGGTFAGDVTVNGNIKVTGSIMRGSITTATNSSNTHTCTLADNDNFNIAVANAATTIALTVVSADIGKSGIITITNPASVGSLSFVALPSYMLTPSGATVNFVTTANAVSVISYYVLATDKVLCNYIGNFA